jgi:hypothetical protein
MSRVTGIGVRHLESIGAKKAVKAILIVRRAATKGNPVAEARYRVARRCSWLCAGRSVAKLKAPAGLRGDCWNSEKTVGC